MSTSSDHERELRDALEQQATGVKVVTDFAPKAIARRRRDHRNRMALVATAGAAAIAVAVPVLWGFNRPDIMPGPALPTVSTSSKASTRPPASNTAPPSRSPQTTAPAPSGPATPSAPPAIAGMASPTDNVLSLALPPSPSPGKPSSRRSRDCRVEPSWCRGVGARRRP